MTYDIHYAVDSELELVGYTDFDWVGDSIDQKSTSRYDSCLVVAPFDGLAKIRLP